MAEFDLNLVRTFVLLYETGSVTATAEELHLTQPTVSYSLGKLRRRFGDELFRRTGRGLVPTSSAHRLYEPLRRALSEIDDAVSRRDVFDPTTMGARFTLALSDLGETTLLPRVISRARTAAPYVTFAVRPLDVDEVERQLARGEIDAFVATPLLTGRQVQRIPLFRERYVGLVASDHPRITTDEVSLARLSEEHHVTVFGSSGHLGPRATLAAYGLLDRVALEVTRFSLLPYLLEQTDLIAIVPAYVAEEFARAHRVKLLRLPFDVEPIEVAAYARHDSARSPAQRWLVAFLTEVLTEQVSDTQMPPGGGGGIGSTRTQAGSTAAGSTVELLPGQADGSRR